jgi:hypothetical protein
VKGLFAILNKILKQTVFAAHVLPRVDGDNCKKSFAVAVASSRWSLVSKNKELQESK